MKTIADTDGSTIEAITPADLDAIHDVIEATRAAWEADAKPRLHDKGSCCVGAGVIGLVLNKGCRKTKPRMLLAAPGLYDGMNVPYSAQAVAAIQAALVERCGFTRPPVRFTAGRMD